MPKSESSESNLFSEFTKIFTGLLIGLASFQLLVPLIWNYLSDLMHLEKITSYRIIISIYFLLPCTILAIWWQSEQNKISRLFILFDGEGSNKTIPLFIHQLLIIFWVLIVINIGLFHFASRFDNRYLFYLLQFISTIIEGAILYFVIQLVNKNIKQSGLIKKRKYYFLIYCIAALFAFFVLFEWVYLAHKDKTREGDKRTFERLKISNPGEINNAFRLNELKNALTSSRKKFESNLDQVALLQKVAQLNELSNCNGVAGKVNSALYDLFENGKGAAEHLASPHTQNNMRLDDCDNSYVNLNALNHLIDWSADAIYQHKGEVLFTPPPYKIDSILEYKPVSHSETQDSTELLTAYKRYDDTIGLLKMLENKVTQLCKNQLTLVLGNTQMKGIFLFSFFLIFLLSLYLLLKINEDLLNAVPKEKLSDNDREEIILLNNKYLSNVWLMINVGGWLLIPLFKPVTESSINLDKPISTMTFSRYFTTEKIMTNNTNTVTKTEHGSQEQSPITVNIYNYPGKSDTVFIPIHIDSTGKNDLLKTILSRVNQINDKTDDGVILNRLYEYMDSKKVEKTDNNTFKNKKQ